MPINTDAELSEIWSRVGLSPQLFPKYYGMGPVQFFNGGSPSGTAGSRARLSRALTNSPQIIYGVRLQNVYELPSNPTEAQVQLFRTLKEWIDGEQVVTINLSQQDVTAQSVLQTQLVGKHGSVWAPFPEPYPMAGGNNVEVSIERLTSYPVLDGVNPVLPSCVGTLLAAEFKADMSSVPARRVHGR